jgi:hypothetical protein
MNACILLYTTTVLRLFLQKMHKPKQIVCILNEQTSSPQRNARKELSLASICLQEPQLFPLLFLLLHTCIDKNCHWLWYCLVFYLKTSGFEPDACHKCDVKDEKVTVVVRLWCLTPQPLFFPVSFWMRLSICQTRPDRGGQENGFFPGHEVNSDFPALACHFYDHIHFLGQKRWSLAFIPSTS